MKRGENSGGPLAISEVNRETGDASIDGELWLLSFGDSEICFNSGLFSTVTEEDNP